jgi:hypothetical protein
MHLAWLYLLQAEMMRDGVDFRYFRKPRRLEYIDGEPKRWDLTKSVGHRWPAGDPVRANLEFFIALRNKIEHRYSTHLQAIALATSGHAQALLLNFDNELVHQFGANQTLAATLRFPVFVGTFTERGEDALRQLHAKLPSGFRSFVSSYHAKLDPAVASDQRFEFRLRLVPEVMPRSGDALALEFVRLDDLTETARDALIALGRRGHVIVREHQRPVANYGRMRPTEAAQQVQAGIPFVFKVHPHFVAACRRLQIRPPSKDPHPERTREDFCVYDAVHRDYSYTPACVKYLQKKLRTELGFREVTGLEPVPKPLVESQPSVE